MGNGMQIATEVTKATAVGAQVTAIFLEAMIEAMKRYDESRSLHILKDYVENNEGELFSKVFDRRLISQVQHSLFYHSPPIPNAIFEDNVSGKLTIIFRKEDMEDIDDVFEGILNRNKGIISEQDVGKDGEDFFKIKFDNISKNEKDAIVLNAKKMNTEISVYRNDNDTYRISFPNEQEKIDKIFSNAYFETRGYGARFIDYHSDERMEAIRARVDSGEKINIVSPTNNSILITVDNSGFTVFRHNQPTQTVSRNQTSFSEDLFTAIHDQLTIPLVFDDKQLASLSNEEKYQLIPTSPVNDEKQQKLAEIERNVQRLIGLKMSLENDPATEINLDFLNPDVSFEQFFHLENINDRNNAEISANETSLKGLKEYYDSLSVEEEQYFYQFLSEYHSFMDTIHDKSEVVEIETGKKDLDNIILDADKATELDDMAYDALFDPTLDEVE